MANIPPPPDSPRISNSSPALDPPLGQSKQAKERRRKLGEVPSRERTFLKNPPGYVTIPDPEPDVPPLTSTERAAEARRRSKERGDELLAAEKPESDPWTAEKNAAWMRQWIMDKPERDAREQVQREEKEACARAKAEAEAAEAEAAKDVPEPTSTDPHISPYERRYLRVQEFLDYAESTNREERKLTARRLRAIEAGRREALAIEYAYPRENDSTRKTEQRIFAPPLGGPESVDAVPTKWTVDSAADLSYSSMVATTFTITPKAAELMVHTAQPLHQYFPRTLELMDEGRTSYRHALAVVESGWFVPDDFKAEYEEILLPFAETMTPPQFARKAKAVAATYQDNPIEERHQEALQRRSFTVTPCEDGMADITMYMDAAGAYAIRNRVKATSRGIFRKDSGRTRAQTDVDVAAEILLTGITEAAGTPIIDQLNLAERKPQGVVFREVPDDGEEAIADGSTDADSALGTGKVGTGLAAGILAKVAIHVPALTLLEKGNEPAYLENYGPISLETALLLAGNAPGFTRILTDPDTGATLSVGTRLYKVPASMRCFLLFRDRTCRFPGCSMPAQYCDIDHTDDWQDGGETKVTNLVTLCRKHHMLKHNTGWDYSMDIDADLTWVSPSGRETPTHPANHIPVKTEGGTVVPDVGIKNESERADSLSDINSIWDVEPDTSGREYLF